MNRQKIHHPNPESNTFINDLDDDCLVNIFKFLIIPERWIAAQVCQRWKIIDQLSSCYIKTLDTSHSSWSYIFDFDTSEVEKSKILWNILSNYGNFIQRLKYGDNPVSQFVPLFSFFPIVRACRNIRYFVLHEGVRGRDMIELTNKYNNIVEFRCNYDVERGEESFKELFTKNVNLKYVQVTLTSDKRASCLLALQERPIEELIITGMSQRVLNNVTTLLTSLQAIRIFGLKLQGKYNQTGLVKVLGDCQTLEIVNIEIKGIHNLLITSLSQLNNLYELNVKDDSAVTDEFLSNLSSQLIHLKSLNISGCSNVTDEGLNVISKLENIQKLNIDRLKIKGTGLIQLKTLKHLSCQTSDVFDTYICHVLNSCVDIEFLNIDGCSKMYLTVLETAGRIMRTRQNRKLRIIADFGLIYMNKMKAPAELELIFPRYFWFVKERIKDRIADRNVGTSCYNIQETAIFLGKINSENVGNQILYDDCFFNIFKFLTVPNRMKMERVSVGFQELLEMSLRRIKTLDLSVPDWMFHQKSEPNKFQFILNATLMKCGIHLKDIVLRNGYGLNIVVKHCHQLRKITIFSKSLKDEHLALLAVHYCNLIQLSLSCRCISDEALSEIFKSNQKLKSLIIHDADDLNFQCLLHLNAKSIESIKLYSVYMDSRNQRSQNNFITAVSSFVNLRDLIVLPGILMSEVVIESVKNSTTLETLIFGNRSPVESASRFSDVLRLKTLQTFGAYQCWQLTDELIGEISTHMELLSYIDITGCTNVTDRGLQYISMLPNLHTLILRGLSTIKGTGLSALKGRNFQRLECPLCCSIRSGPLCDILLNCINLKLLNIVRCTRLDASVMETAVDVTSRRTNGIMLRLIVDESLARMKRASTPFLDVLMCENQ